MFVQSPAIGRNVVLTGVSLGRKHVSDGLLLSDLLRFCLCPQSTFRGTLGACDDGSRQSEFPLLRLDRLFQPVVFCDMQMLCEKLRGVEEFIFDHHPFVVSEVEL